MRLALAVTLAATLAALAPSPAAAADFYIHFDKCKFVVGYLIQSNESLKGCDRDPLTARRQPADDSCHHACKKG